MGKGDVLGDTATLDGEADGVGDADCPADGDGDTGTEGDAAGDGEALCVTVGEPVAGIEEEVGLV